MGPPADAILAAADPRPGLVIRFVTEPSASRSPIVSAGASAEPEVLLKLPLDTAGGLEASIANPVVLRRVLPVVLSTDPALTVGNPTSAALLFRAPEVVIWDCDVEGKSEPVACAKLRSNLRSTFLRVIEKSPLAMTRSALGTCFPVATT